MESPTRYEIRVRGHLDGGWSDWFAGMTCTNLPGGEAVLDGILPDQAALHGVLARIRNLNLALISIRRAAPAEGRNQT
jgi:hypothetical protein